MAVVTASALAVGMSLGDSAERRMSEKLDRSPSSRFRKNDDRRAHNRPKLELYSRSISPNHSTSRNLYDRLDNLEWIAFSPKPQSDAAIGVSQKSNSMEVANSSSKAINDRRDRLVNRYVRSSKSISTSLSLPGPMNDLISRESLASSSSESRVRDSKISTAEKTPSRSLAQPPKGQDQAPDTIKRIRSNQSKPVSRGLSNSQSFKGISIASHPNTGGQSTEGRSSFHSRSSSISRGLTNSTNATELAAVKKKGSTSNKRNKSRSPSAMRRTRADSLPVHEISEGLSKPCTVLTRGPKPPTRVQSVPRHLSDFSSSERSSDDRLQQAHSHSRRRLKNDMHVTRHGSLPRMKRTDDDIGSICSKDEDSLAEIKAFIREIKEAHHNSSKVRSIETERNGSCDADDHPPKLSRAPESRRNVVGSHSDNCQNLLSHSHSEIRSSTRSRSDRNLVGAHSLNEHRSSTRSRSPKSSRNLLSAKSVHEGRPSTRSKSPKACRTADKAMSHSENRSFKLSRSPTSRRDVLDTKSALNDRPSLLSRSTESRRNLLSANSLTKGCPSSRSKPFKSNKSNRTLDGAMLHPEDGPIMRSPSSRRNVLEAKSTSDDISSTLLRSPKSNRNHLYALSTSEATSAVEQIASNWVELDLQLLQHPALDLPRLRNVDSHAKSAVSMPETRDQEIRKESSLRMQHIVDQSPVNRSQPLPMVIQRGVPSPFKDYVSQLALDPYDREESRSLYFRMMNECDINSRDVKSMNSTEFLTYMNEISQCELSHHTTSSDVDSDVLDAEEETKTAPDKLLSPKELLAYLHADNKNDMPQKSSVERNPKVPDTAQVLNVAEMADILNHVATRHGDNELIRWDVIGRMANDVGYEQFHACLPVEYICVDPSDDDSSVSSISVTEAGFTQDFWNSGGSFHWETAVSYY